MPTGLYDRKKRGKYQKDRPILIQPEDHTIRHIPLTRGLFTIVDAENYDELMKYNWYSLWAPASKSFYAARSVRISSTQSVAILMHRQLLGLNPEDPLVGDHENRIKLDNRIRNLRITNEIGNACNQGLRKDNTSGVKGVCWNRFRMKWHATIQYNKKKMHIMLSDDFGEACLARREKAKELHGEFSGDE